MGKTVEYGQTDLAELEGLLARAEADIAATAGISHFFPGLPRGFDLYLSVVDHNGRPVPTAEVFGGDFEGASFGRRLGLVFFSGWPRRKALFKKRLMTWIKIIAGTFLAALILSQFISAFSKRTMSK
jgi:hypothetical protein